MIAFYIAVTAVGLVALVAAVLGLRSRRRERSLRYLLDRADALEALLHTTRDRMSAMRTVVQRVPSDIAAVAHASLDAQPQVQQGLRDVLEHRLWISRHGLQASQRELDRACAALDRAYATISERLDRLENAGAELIDVTQASIDQAAREPAALKRAREDGGS
ncbi:hypothetical protein [Chiayiivirga flava]|uniref:Vacuolar-type H+-ATPase subunit I/STV1 n=1 Tax=Chiayiivirga flava TaxID=659595 RepID=A0A7W8D2J1_9GAMM|nr:hypothetical protein [Chiayiivirga flava]MBB5206803.1 vacuolar-type H+-ATPase subunit I/STV1 [Chiayiivirga flava]